MTAYVGQKELFRWLFFKNTTKLWGELWVYLWLIVVAVLAVFKGLYPETYPEPHHEIAGIASTIIVYFVGTEFSKRAYKTKRKKKEAT